MLKMSDVFVGKVVAHPLDTEAMDEIRNGRDLYTIEDDKYWIAVDKDHAEYAAHAINSHDAMVEALNAARDYLSDLPTGGPVLLGLCCMIDDALAEVPTDATQ